MYKPVANFYKSIFEPKLMTVAGKQDLRWSREYSSAVSFMHLKLRRERKEDYTKLGESKVEIGVQDS